MVEAIRAILIYTQHVLEMENPPSTIAVPTKMLLDLKKSIRKELGIE